MRRVELLTRPGCGLCDELEAVLARLPPWRRVEVTRIDVSTDPELEARFGHRIPVLRTPDGRILLEGNVDPRAVRRALGRRRSRRS